MPELTTKRDQLLDLIRGYGTCAVAFSGGIDSTVVAKAAQLALGDRAVAVTGTSASLATGELQEARELARAIGIRHEVIATDEFSNPDYVRNAEDRCYHCKTELYTQIEAITRGLDVAVVLNGANLDDLGDYRPGMQAAGEHRVESPLAECGFNKADVRALAVEWGLPTWDKPATPCLSSRVAYGEAVSPERLAMIDAAEQYLRQQGLRTLRVRYHQGDMARLEVPLDALARFCEPQVRETLVAHFKALGFKYVTLDLEGFRSGSLNALVTIESLSKAK
jgi:pyridinium-3,5-biscarboxylic acid mononucleotide sulfurtransferase